MGIIPTVDGLKVAMETMAVSVSSTIVGMKNVRRKAMGRATISKEGMVVMTTLTKTAQTKDMEPMIHMATARPKAEVAITTTDAKKVAMAEMMTMVTNRADTAAAKEADKMADTVVIKVAMVVVVMAGMVINPIMGGQKVHTPKADVLDKAMALQRSVSIMLSYKSCVAD